MNTKTFAPDEIADIFMNAADLKVAQNTLGQKGFPVHRVMSLSYMFTSISDDCAFVEAGEQDLRRQFIEELGDLNHKLNNKLLTVGCDA
ncbi:MAG TPA: hypothetical protein DEA55_02455 [Rhodospirillaceae bacterium]|nr:hypothetical protein [Rhodospirillaceae bacterium]